MLLLTLGLILSPGVSSAKGCFPDVYYEMMFKAEPQQATGGDPRLMGMSDYLAATGKDPDSDGGKSGCMCGVNNGRWDQMLLNDSPADAKRAPVSFKILSVRVDFSDKEGKAKGKPIIVSPARLGTCFGASVKAKGMRAFDHPGGMTKAADVLEPGENMVGCLCLGEELAGQSGTVKVAVTYQRLVFMRPVAVTGSKDGMRGQAQVKALAKGEAAYYTISLPKDSGAADLSITLAGGSGLTLYTLDAADGFKGMMADWKAGELKAGSLKAGSTVWVMLRAKADKAAGTLKVAYRPQGAAAAPAAAGGVRVIEAAGQEVRAFTAYILGMGGSEKKKKSPFDPEPSKKGSCCTGEG